MKYRIDQGDPGCVALGICECGRRFLALDRPTALERLARHEAIWHPADKNVRANLSKSRRAGRPPKIQPTSVG